jgi:hypothetical protein
MPTGYTAELMEKGQDFNNFALCCARAFGACIELRDDSFGPAPRKIPRSKNTYHQDALKRALAESAEFAEMSKKDKNAWAKETKAEAIESAEKSLERQKQENKRLAEMEAEVDAWNPPTADHQGLKDFMLQQIDVSKHDMKYPIESLQSAKKKTLAEYIADRVEAIRWGIEYHEEHLHDDEEREDSRDTWLNELYVSLGM